jgi:hypothetical protein
VPERATICGLPAALSVMLTLPVRVFVVVGLKVTMIEQFDPVATLAPHAFVWEKSPLFAPVIAMFVIVKVAVPVLERFTV